MFYSRTLVPKDGSHAALLISRQEINTTDPNINKGSFFAKNYSQSAKNQAVFVLALRCDGVGRVSSYAIVSHHARHMIFYCSQRKMRISVKWRRYFLIQ